ncbi:hypothetical protein JAO21_12980, partial [Escherichia coli]|nr:hypothetical protein [Escherichia coli]MBI0350106.1 hypothetical protein [Escherichia coli]MBI0353300.1 hypothetical protein [Escherichia coli]
MTEQLSGGMSALTLIVFLVHVMVPPVSLRDDPAKGIQARQYPARCPCLSG